MSNERIFYPKVVDDTGKLRSQVKAGWCQHYIVAAMLMITLFAAGLRLNKLDVNGLNNDERFFYSIPFSCYFYSGFPENAEILEGSSVALIEDGNFQHISHHNLTEGISL